MERALLLFHPLSFPVFQSARLAVLAALAVLANLAAPTDPVTNPIQ